MCFESHDYKSQQGHPNTTKQHRPDFVENQRSICLDDSTSKLDEKNIDDFISTKTSCIGHTLIDEMIKCHTEQSSEYIGEIKFMKADAGKNMLSLIDPQFIILLGEILTFGAAKYAPNNWQLCEDTSRYKDALLRHIYAYLSGEQLDPESGMPHLGHAAFGLMCLNYFDNLKKEPTK